MVINNILVTISLIFISFFFFIEQLVVPGKTEVASSSLYGAPYFPNNTVDGVTQQHITYCMHTKNEIPITEAWLRINLLKAYSIKQIKLWYRGDGSYRMISSVSIIFSFNE